MLILSALEPHRCRKSLPTRLRHPVITCFPGLEFWNFNDLVLIRVSLVHATRAGASPREIPATRGRPPGIPNPRRRMPDLTARPLSAQALADLIDRKPHLLRPLAAQFLPPPAAADPAERLGIELSSLRTIEDCREVLATVLETVARGAIPPVEGARIAWRARLWLHAAPRLARSARRVDSARAGVRLRTASPI